MANLLLVAVVLLLLAQEYQTLALIRLRGWFGMLLLTGISLGIGWLCGGPGLATRKSLALTTAVRNVAVGLVIVSDNFAETPAGPCTSIAIIRIFPEPGSNVHPRQRDRLTFRRVGFNTRVTIRVD